jgi:hypothetical protein
VVLAALCTVEITMYVTYARREIVWAFPGGFDQAGYLSQAYRHTHESSSLGLLKATKLYLARSQPTGVLLPLQASVHNTVVGTGRLGALSVNFVYLLLFQVVFACTLFWLTRDWWIALTGFGLVQALKTAFQLTGSAFDFRIDFVSYCLYGTFLCALIRSRLFATVRGSAVVGAVAGLLVLFRFLTAVYLVGVFSALCGLLLVVRVAGSSRAVRARAAVRLRGWLTACAVLTVIAAPFLIKQREAIRAYYVVGHITSTEKEIRAAEFGVQESLDAALYYPRSLLHDHTGRPFWWAAGVVVALGLIGCIRSARAPVSGGKVNSPALPVVGAVALVGLGVPFLVLSAHAMKSPVVGVVLLPGILWVVLAPLVASARVWAVRSWPVRSTAIGVVVLGLLTQLGLASAPSQYSALHGPEIMAAMGDLFDACERKGIAEPVFFADAQAHDFLCPAVQVTEFEQRGRWREYQNASGSLFAEDDEVQFQRVVGADLVVLGRAHAGGFQYPADVQYARLRPRLRAYCDAHFLKLGEYSIGGRVVELYVRGQLRLDGITTDGWITDTGVKLVGTLADMKRCRRIELHRSECPNFLGRAPEVTAELLLPGRAPVALAASATDDLGAVRIDWRPVELPPETPITIRVRFSGSFTPREKGLGSDPRSLVMNVGPRPRVHMIQEPD